MYEIVILGELLEGDTSGYRLGLVLNHILGPGRKISNGTLHPILVKLSRAGFIEWREDPANSRGKKLASITAAGHAEFERLMAEPVVENARRDETYRFKISQLRKVAVPVRLQILRDYRANTQDEYDNYQINRDHVKALVDMDDGEMAWTVKTIELYMQLSVTKLEWIDNQIEALSEKGTK